MLIHTGYIQDTSVGLDITLCRAHRGWGWGWAGVGTWAGSVHRVRVDGSAAVIATEFPGSVGCSDPY